MEQVSTPTDMFGDTRDLDPFGIEPSKERMVPSAQKRVEASVAEFRRNADAKLASGNVPRTQKDISRAANRDSTYIHH